MFGKTYNTIGSTDSNFIIKTKGDLKVQWGGKFIDIIKNGKIASSSTNILKTASSSDDISDNGIYLIPTEEGSEVWISIDGTKVNLAGEVGTTYVSFLAEQKEVTTDQKYTALTNAGFYYETLEEAQQAGIKAGIIFVIEENKLYLAKEGQLSEYIALSSNTRNDKNTYFDEITIQDLEIYNDGSNMTISSQGLQFKINEQLAISLDSQLRSYLSIAMQTGTFIQSNNATSTSGYRLYVKDGKSILEVDSLVWRDMGQVLGGISATRLDDVIVYSLHSNVIQSACSNENNVTCTLRYPNSFPSQGKVFVIVPLSIQVNVDYEQEDTNIEVMADIGDIVATQDIKIQVVYVADGAEGTMQLTIPTGDSAATSNLSGISDFGIDGFTIISGPSNINDQDVYGKGQLVECDIVNIDSQEITISMNSSILNLFLTNCEGSFIYLANAPLIKIIQNTIDILDRSKTIVDEDTLEDRPDDTIHTRIGVVNEEDFDSLKECPEEQEEVGVGIYSDNFIGLNSKLYDVIFKKRCNFPRYDENIEIPEDFSDQKYNAIVPNINWIKELLKLAVPSGTIAMFNGNSDLPEGWAICDGTNETPNLVGEFIKTVASADEVGDNDSILDENNELILSQDYLPKHSHPHKAHTHSLSGDLSGTTGSSGDLSVSLEYSDYNQGIESVSKTFVTSVTGEGITTETGTVDGVSNIKTQGGTATGGSHTHSISLETDEGTSLSSATSEEQTLSDSEQPNKPLKIKPRSYSLVFIMKL